MRNYEKGTPVLRKAADGSEECLTVEFVGEDGITFRDRHGHKLVRNCRTDRELRFALAGYRVVPPAKPMNLPA